MGGGEESVSITMVVENGSSFWVAGRLIFSIPACATTFWIAASGGKLSELYRSNPFLQDLDKKPLLSPFSVRFSLSIYKNERTYVHAVG